MNIKYVGEGFIIDCHAHKIQTANDIVDVRPKTFELLLYLIERPDQVLSKQTLLETIWDDVNVEEHVVVQSIAELRKVFGEQKVVQTHPRKGYSWVGLFDKQIIEKTNTDNSGPSYDQVGSSLNTSIAPINKHVLPTSKKLWLTVIAAITLMLLVLVFFTQKDTVEKSVKSSETIYILPTKNNMMDSKFNWISLGIMDTLISQAKADSNIMPVDFVLSSMQLAKMNRDYNDEQISRLFTITGAHTVVDSEISRRLGEFQLVYRIHQANNIKRGVIFDKSLDELIASFADVIGDITPLKPQEIIVNQTSFNHELFVEAIELSKNGKLGSAILLLKSLLSIEPDNLHAYRLLIDWLQFQLEFEKALIYTTQVLSKLDSETNKANFYYRHGYNLFRLNRLDEAWRYSQLLDQQLVIENNPFYLGFAGQLKGEILIAKNQPEQAKLALLAAHKQFEQISHSIGLTTVHILLSQVEAQLGNIQQQQKHLQDARNVVKKYQIQELIKLFRIELQPL